jgi:hypothetical protein
MVSIDRRTFKTKLATCMSRVSNKEIFEVAEISH